MSPLTGAFSLLSLLTGAFSLLSPFTGTPSLLSPLTGAFSLLSTLTGTLSASFVLSALPPSEFFCSLLSVSASTDVSIFAALSVSEISFTDAALNKAVKLRICKARFSAFEALPASRPLSSAASSGLSSEPSVLLSETS